VSEQLSRSSLIIVDDADENGNNNNNNCDEDMNGNNNNDEEFNNNNDFNCLDSNQVVPASSVENEPEPFVESPEIFSDDQSKLTAEQMFDNLKSLDRKSFMDMHGEDNEKNLVQCETEAVPEVKLPNEKVNCDGDDVQMKEPLENVESSMTENVENLEIKNEEDIEMNEETVNNAEEDQIPEKSEQNGAIPVIKQEIENQVIEYEVKVEESVIVETLPENEFIEPPESDNGMKNVEEIPEASKVSDESTVIPIEREDVQDNSACVKECEAYEVKEFQADEVIAVDKTIDETCDNTSILSSD
jgi:hypothetical protein